MTDFFESSFGAAKDEMRHPRRAALLDKAFDLRSKLNSRHLEIDRAALSLPQQKILVVGVEVPNRRGALKSITRQMSKSRHEVTVSTVSMQPKGKFENVNDAILKATERLAGFDWLIITDDDVELPPRFTDRFVAAAAITGLTIAQPAHKFESYTSYHLTRRGFGSLVRQTKFVEIGPVTLIHKSAFDLLFPFPKSRWAWGLDLVWASLAESHGWKLGVIDALPIRHLQPVGQSYGHEDAILEARRTLATNNITTKRADLLGRGFELIT